MHWAFSGRNDFNPVGGNYSLQQRVKSVILLQLFKDLFPIWIRNKLWRLVKLYIPGWSKVQQNTFSTIYN